jgi:superfamily II DNA/RNA helicase
MEISEAVLEAGKRLGYNSLKEEQIECITKFMFEHDVFFILPTGFGKQLVLPVCLWLLIFTYKKLMMKSPLLSS